MTEKMGGMGDLLSSLASNPQALSMLSSLLGGMGASEGKKAAEKGCKEQESESPEDCRSSSLALPPPAVPERRPQATDPRAALLRSLKPFLPPEKCRVIDTLVFLLEAMGGTRGKGG